MGQKTTSRLQHVLMAGQQQRAYHTTPLQAGAEMDAMYRILGKNDDVKQWLQKHTNEQSLVKNPVVVTRWVLASAGASKKKFIKELANNTFLKEDKDLIRFLDKRFLYALFPTHRAGIDAIVRAYLGSKKVFYVGVAMYPGVAMEYLLDPPSLGGSAQTLLTIA